MVKLISTGHLTGTDKRHIEALFASGRTQAKINRAVWTIDKGTPDKNEYVVSKYVNDRGWGWIGSELRQSKYTYTIIFKK